MVRTVLNSGWTDLLLTGGWFAFVFALLARAQLRATLRAARTRVARPSVGKRR